MLRLELGALDHQELLTMANMDDHGEGAWVQEGPRRRGHLSDQYEAFR